MSENQNPDSPSSPSNQPPDRAGVYIGLVCGVLLLLIIFVNTSC